MSTSDQGALYLLDGNSLVFRAFFAVPADLRTTDGTVTNAVHGFVSMLIYLFAGPSPDGDRSCLGSPGKDVQRRRRPRVQGESRRCPRPPLPAVRDGARSARRSLCRMSGPRPATRQMTCSQRLPTRARDSGQDVVVVTGDRDAFQLVQDPHVAVLYTRRGISDTTLYDDAGILDRTGVTPAEYPVLAALRGDPSDNLAGVPGVGEKTAAKLVNKYKDLDGIFSHLDEMTPSLRKNLARVRRARPPQLQGHPSRARRTRSPSSPTSSSSEVGTSTSCERYSRGSS